MTKVPFELLDLDFGAEMCENWRRGLKEGRKPNDWKTMEPTEENKNKYLAKILRHLHDYTKSDNSEDKKINLVAIACNANILWELTKNE